MVIIISKEKKDLEKTPLYISVTLARRWCCVASSGKPDMNSGFFCSLNFFQEIWKIEMFPLMLWFLVSTRCRHFTHDVIFTIFGQISGFKVEEVWFEIL